MEEPVRPLTCWQFAVRQMVSVQTGDRTSQGQLSKRSTPGVRILSCRTEENYSDVECPGATYTDTVSAFTASVRCHGSSDDMPCLGWASETKAPDLVCPTPARTELAHMDRPLVWVVTEQTEQDIDRRPWHGVLLWPYGRPGRHVGRHVVRGAGTRERESFGKWTKTGYVGIGSYHGDDRVFQACTDYHCLDAFPSHTLPIWFSLLGGWQPSEG